MASNVICSASTSYKKQNGTLILTKKRNLNWQPDAQQGEPVKIGGSQLTGLFASKPGSAKIILRVSAVLKPGEPEQNLNFTFIAASSAVSDREHFKTGLSDVIAFYKQQRETAATAAPSPAVVDGAAASSPRASTSAQTLESFDTTYDVGLRIRLLKQEPELRSLHEALVLTGQISEEEFWESREHLLQAEQQQLAQKQGRAATLVDARAEVTNDGDVKVVVTPQLIADIFAQHPIVQRAYNDNVPPVGGRMRLLFVAESVSHPQLNQTEFWQRFFSSKLYNKIRASSRQAGDTIKDDLIFDKYLDMDEDGQFSQLSSAFSNWLSDAEPDNLDSEHIYRLLDLAATEEDHGEVCLSRNVISGIDSMDRRATRKTSRCATAMKRLPYRSFDDSTTILNGCWIRPCAFGVHTVASCSR
jgi:transcription initiation factor TFIIH subunit 1